MSSKSKKETLIDAKQEIFNILNTVSVERIFFNAKYYIIDEDTAEKIIAIDGTLKPLRTESKRGKAYDVRKIVNFINYGKPAYSFSFTIVDKYVLITDNIKCCQAAPVEFIVDYNFLIDRLRKRLEKSNYSQDFKDSVMNKLKNKLEKERDFINFAANNPEEHEFEISGYTDKISYAQINFAYLEKNDKGFYIKKGKSNKHLSKLIPNIIIFREFKNADNHRPDMKTKYLLERGFKKYGRRIYIKKKNVNE
ncbi:hypothetical protein CP985_03235 [Malaciobacter mytili LMG 24559]|uniref:Uncharacterized protein n=1 Tax=Malaciobacter mytili LMG 24559 TaxID=1032238 RepID=A0AAX2AJD1_9BACT|nr:hypothetical protein [Malaciobacter mytili]AXH16373.1 hypothetical protein AMYT_a0073 [Malaciobacter mytili LMG 24559]RXK16437.1 hypothetical protein CP985_03235 [Malaciobacter mytili LMG 24559]